jgi:MSHA biogenesis protein MshP
MKRHHRQRGLSLVTAIFLLVVLAGLAAVIVNVTTQQQTSSALDVQGTRAYLAARAGVEWGLHRQLISGALCSATSGASTTNSFALPAGSTLSQFTVTVVCTTTLLDTLKRYRIRATSCNQPTGGACPNGNNSTDYVQRVVQVDFGD